MEGDQLAQAPADEQQIEGGPDMMGGQRQEEHGHDQEGRIVERQAQELRPAGKSGRPKDERVQVVVYADHGARVGLVVGQIADIVEETITRRGRATRPGVLFTAVVQGRVTEFLDVEAVIRRVDPEFFHLAQTEGA